MNFEYLGPYRILDELGRGGMGSVLRGEHAKSGLKVAIKVIAASLADQERFRRRFASEIETLKRLRHPNIVELIGYGEEHGRLFYAMELVDGETLQDRLRREKKLDTMRVIDICISIVAALKQAHDFGVIHRDLKPANVMLTKRNEVKLTDFGIAKIFGASDATAVGAVIGTADFMPPEQAEGKPVSGKSDLYSVGALAFASLTGRPPFVGKSLPEVLHAVRYEETPHVAKYAPDVPNELDELISHLLAKEPAKRPPTALVVLNRLKAMREGLKARDALGEKPSPEAGDCNNKEMHPASQEKRLTSIDLPDENETQGSESKVDAPNSRRGPSGTEPARAQHKTDTQRSSISERPSLPDTDDQTRVTPHADLPKELEDYTDLKNYASPDSETYVLPKGKSESDPSPSTEKSLDFDFADQIAGPEEATQVATPSKLESRFPTSTGGTQAAGRTRYTTVDESGPSLTTVLDTHPDPPSAVGQWVSIGLLTLALLGCLYGLYRTTRPPSADELFAVVEQAYDSQAPEAMFAAEGAALAFQERFPEDDRNSINQEVLAEIDRLSVVRSLQRTARRKGRDELEPIEQAYLDCLDAQTISTRSAFTKFRAFLSVYATLPELSPAHEKLVRSAEQALREVEQQGLDSKNAAAEQLERQMEWAIKSLPTAARQKFLLGIVELYEEKEWAASVVARAKELSGGAAELNSAEPNTTQDDRTNQTATPEEPGKEAI